MLTGTPTPIPVDNLSVAEEKVLGSYRVLDKEDQDAIRRLTTTMAELSASYITTDKPTDS